MRAIPLFFSLSPLYVQRNIKSFCMATEWTSLYAFDQEQDVLDDDDDELMMMILVEKPKLIGGEHNEKFLLFLRPLMH